MPSSEQVVTAEKEDPIAEPAGSRSRRRRGFLNGLSIFQSKHRRGASLDSTACSSFGHGWAHTYKFCDAQPQCSVRPTHHHGPTDGTWEKSRPITSRSWLRTFLGGKKLNRVRGTDTPSSSSSQAKDIHAQQPVSGPVHFATTTDSPHCPEFEASLKPSQTRHQIRGPSDTPLEHHVVRECEAVVAHLRCTEGKEQGMVAAEARLLARDYPTARATLATLGAIAPLVAMLDSPTTFCTHAALRTLYTLAIGNDVNKAAVVDAGAIPKMLNLLQTLNPCIREPVVANLLSLSALDRNKPIIGACGAIAHLVNALQQSEIQRESLRALYNLSLAQCNIKLFVDADAMDVLMTRSSCCTEKALAVVGNMVAVPVGRNVSSSTVESLIGVLKRGGYNSKCQERAAYILMVIAHHSFGHRQAMVAKGAIPALLEVSLLGTALAQKRAVRILECLRDDRRPSTISAPLGQFPPPRNRSHSTKHDHDYLGSKVIVIDHMVQQSLEQNLQRIVRRANLPTSTLHHHRMRADHQSSSSSISCSSSKSLPF